MSVASKTFCVWGGEEGGVLKVTYTVAGDTKT